MSRKQTVENKFEFPALGFSRVVWHHYAKRQGGFYPTYGFEVLAQPGLKGFGDAL